MRGKIKEIMYTTHGPVRTKDGDYVVLNLSRESQGCIHSFKSLRQNIKHVCYFRISVYVTLEYSCLMGTIQLFTITTIFLPIRYMLCLYPI